jgi:hypothetical protein
MRTVLFRRILKSIFDFGMSICRRSTSRSKLVPNARSAPFAAEIGKSAIAANVRSGLAGLVWAKNLNQTSRFRISQTGIGAVSRRILKADSAFGVPICRRSSAGPGAKNLKPTVGFRISRAEDIFRSSENVACTQNLKRPGHFKRACASLSEAMVSQKCISCGRLGVRRQEMQHHARLLIRHGLTMTEANKPRCLRCVQQLIATVSDQEVLRNEKSKFVSLRR